MSKTHYTIILVLALMLGATTTLSASPRPRIMETRIPSLNGAPQTNTETSTKGVFYKVIRPTILRPAFHSSWNRNKDVEAIAPMLGSQSYNHSSMHGGSNTMLAVVGMVVVMAVVMLVVMR